MKIFAAFVGICAFFSADLNTGASLTADLDTRVEKLVAFFRAYRCPQPFHVQEYLRAADANAIDYRLLPAVSVRRALADGMRWEITGGDGIQPEQTSAIR